MKCWTQKIVVNIILILFDHTRWLTVGRESLLEDLGNSVVDKYIIKAVWNASNSEAVMTSYCIFCVCWFSLTKCSRESDFGTGCCLKWCICDTADTSYSSGLLDIPQVDPQFIMVVCILAAAADCISHWVPVGGDAGERLTETSLITYVWYMIHAQNYECIRDFAVIMLHCAYCFASYLFHRQMIVSTEMFTG